MRRECQIRDKKYPNSNCPDIQDSNNPGSARTIFRIGFTANVREIYFVLDDVLSDDQA